MKYNRFMGEYDDNTIYQAGDVVNFDGASYYRKVPGKGISPIARKKPYTVWSRLNEALSTIFPLGGTGGGASLPPAAPYQQLVTGGDGKWVAVDRLAWKKESIEEIFPEQTLEFAEVDPGVYVCEVVPAVFNLTIGEKNIVVWDGTEYECIAKDDGDGNACIEHGMADGGQGTTGDSFFIVSVANEGNFFQSLSSSKSHTISITRIAEDVHRIPDEYLPKMPFCINVIPNDEDGDTYVADKSYNEVKEAETQKRPIVGTFTHKNGLVYTLVGCDGAANICLFAAFDVRIVPKLFKLELVEADGNPVVLYEFELNTTEI